MSGVDAGAEQSIHEALSIKMFSLWYRYEVYGVKSAYEFIVDYFQAPSCIRIKGVANLTGIVTKKTLTIEGVFIETGELLTYQIASSNSVSEVQGDLLQYMKQDVNNIWTRMISYNGEPLRVEKITSELSVMGMESTLREKGVKVDLVLDESFSGVMNNCYLLNDSVGSSFYKAMIGNPATKITPFIMPSNYLKYLRREKMYTPDYNFQAELDVYSMWLNRNRNFVEDLKRILKIVHIDYLIENNLVNPLRGFTLNEIPIKFHKLRPGGNL
jgi:hypothetical protein